MSLQIYKYANILRLLYVDDIDFSKSIMIDVNTDTEEILSIFDATKQFDSDFIKSFINILRVSKTGFKLMYETDGDTQSRAISDSNLSLINKVLPTLKSKESDCPKIGIFLPLLPK